MEQINKDFEKYFYLKEKEKDFYTSTNFWSFGRSRGVFGGQIISQALAAAILSIDPNYHIHARKYDELFEFHVERIRDGGSFASRFVSVKQDGRNIYKMMCSFQKEEESLTEHQFEMPEVYPEDHPINMDADIRDEIIRPIYANIKLYDQVEMITKFAVPVDPKLCESYINILENHTTEGEPRVKTPHSLQWVKIDEDFSDNSYQINPAFLACISDFFITVTIMFPYMTGYNNRKIDRTMGVSLDHSMYFHKRFRVDDWILCEVESPRMVGSRGFLNGKFYSKDGTHFATMIQENLNRTDILSKDVILEHNFKNLPMENSRL
ncbi:hypothetical protein BB558_000518 [Smittium angustum]|uniref:Acyl-CoA thioesterase II n=1 Tax=Smittium angustum TaxID=133377 RepID=A0A2U1JE04_SMIAN|nr:hypothetical protein BB558_000518 [Smittium angustum]